MTDKQYIAVKASLFGIKITQFIQTGILLAILSNYIAKRNNITTIIVLSLGLSNTKA